MYFRTGVGTVFKDDARGGFTRLEDIEHDGSERGRRYIPQGATFPGTRIRRSGVAIKKHCGNSPSKLHASAEFEKIKQTIVSCSRSLSQRRNKPSTRKTRRPHLEVESPRGEGYPEFSCRFSTGRLAAQFFLNHSADSRNTPLVALNSRHRRLCVLLVLHVPRPHFISHLTHHDTVVNSSIPSDVCSFEHFSSETQQESR